MPEHGAPLLQVQFLADAEGAEALVVELPYLVVFLSHQYVNQVPGAKALAAAVNTGQGLAGGSRAVPGRDGMQAGITVVAAGRDSSPKYCNKVWRRQLVISHRPSMDSSLYRSIRLWFSSASDCSSISRSFTTSSRP